MTAQSIPYPDDQQMKKMKMKKKKKMSCDCDRSKISFVIDWVLYSGRDDDYDFYFGYASRDLISRDWYNSFLYTYT